MNILEVKNVTKKIGKREILHDASFSIKEGSIVGLVGPNGAGKSTLIKTILGLYRIHHGEVLIGGYSVKKEYEKALESVGTIIESPDMYSHLSGLKNLEIYAKMYRIKELSSIMEVVRKLKLEKRIKEPVKNYSLGMKQRLGIAQAILHHPKLLILDEPTNGLDPRGIYELRELLINLKKEGTTILISSHILSEIEQVCDQIIMIDEGTIVETFDLKELKERGITLEKEFLTKMNGSKGQIG